MILHITLLASIVLSITVPAAAQMEVYNNGPTNGQNNVVLITQGSEGSDNFPFVNNNDCGQWGGNPCSVNGVSFAVWMFPGDVLESAEVSITSEEFGGITYFDQTLSFSESNCFTNNEGFNICTETASFADVYLSSGTYWLNLQNAQLNSDDLIGWDMNNGPSLASANSLGTVPSESFTILGSSTTYCYYCGTVPEPTGLGWLAAGLLGLLMTGARKYL